MRTSHRRGGRLLAVVATAAAAGMLLVSCAGEPRAVPNGTIPPVIDVSGRTVPYDGLQAWSVASVASRDSTAVVVYATGADDGGGACGPPVIRLSAEETATSVRISAAMYEEPTGPATACSAIGYAPSPQHLRLQHAIGERTVFDASSGKEHTLLVGTDYPRLVGVPSTFLATPLGQDTDTSTAVRLWTDHGAIALSLRTGAPASVRATAPYGRIVQQLEIGGAPATVYRSGTGRYGQMSVQWTPNATQTITVGFENTARTRWTVAEAVRLARGVTNYRSGQTGRLPQPSTPGTAAATYSSGDGPVVHAPNLLKSSGVYIGVNCQGTGRVTVAMRGTTYPIECIAKLSHHLVESIGEPNDAFFLDVSATDGVRWAVTLARASLDGS